mmetsp:Transcript_37495/g.94207  ORF Transcript_37495/g.94207 Transcript_37495/m.94207 type:complete len:212 (-) Transcript_37495:2104-2739(-)
MAIRSEGGWVEDGGRETARACGRVLHRSLRAREHDNARCGRGGSTLGVSCQVHLVEHLHIVPSTVHSNGLAHRRDVALQIQSHTVLCGDLQVVLSEGCQRKDEDTAELSMHIHRPHAHEAGKLCVSPVVNPRDSPFNNGDREIHQILTRRTHLVVPPEPQVCLVEHVCVVSEVDEIIRHPMRLPIEHLIGGDCVCTIVLVDNIVVHENVFV